MTASTLLDADAVGRLTEAGQQLRVDAVRCSSAANSGHPTSSLCADLMAVLLARHLLTGQQAGGPFHAPAAMGGPRCPSRAWSGHVLG